MVNALSRFLIRFRYLLRHGRWPRGITLAGAPIKAGSLVYFDHGIAYPANTGKPPQAVFGVAMAPKDEGASVKPDEVATQGLVIDGKAYPYPTLPFFYTPKDKDTE